MTTPTNDQKVTRVITKIMKIINKHKLTVSELVVLYGNLGYHLGGSIAGLQDHGPTLEELQQEYYLNPTVDVGLMLQGLLITQWEEDYLKKPQLSQLAKKKKGE